jgi:hypothetical protein
MATTWDHLIGLVENAELRGFGHQIGNLVPCCRDCNSAKGANDWRAYLRQNVANQSAFEERHSLIATYLEQYGTPVNLKRAAEMLPAEWERYSAIKHEIFSLMAEADKIASRLRGVVAFKTGVGQPGPERPKAAAPGGRRTQFTFGSTERSVARYRKAGRYF